MYTYVYRTFALSVEGLPQVHPKAQTYLHVYIQYTDGVSRAVDGVSRAVDSVSSFLFLLYIYFILGAPLGSFGEISGVYFCALLHV